MCNIYADQKYYILSGPFVYYRKHYEVQRYDRSFNLLSIRPENVFSGSLCIHLLPEPLGDARAVTNYITLHAVMAISRQKGYSRVLL